MPLPKSLKRFFAVLEPGSPASKHQPEGHQQQQQQQQQIFSQDKKSSSGQAFPPPQMTTSNSTTSTTTTTSGNKPGQPNASYLLPTNKPLSNTQTFWLSLDNGGSGSGFN